MCCAWKELRRSGQNLLEEGLEREARPHGGCGPSGQMLTPGLLATFVLSNSIQLKCTELFFSFCFCGGGCCCWGPVGAGEVSNTEKLATQVQSRVLAPTHWAGGAGTFSSHTKRLCCHRNQCWAEWVAWFCNPSFFFLSLCWRCIVFWVSFVLIKIQTVAKKMLPTSRQLKLSRPMTHCQWIGSLAGSPRIWDWVPFLQALYWQATKGHARLRLAG